MAALIFRITDELSARGTGRVSPELLRVVAYVGERVGDTARLLAASNSWSQVAEISGTSKQAAWGGGGCRDRRRLNLGSVPARALGETLCAFQ